MDNPTKSIDTYIIGDNLSVNLGNVSTNNNEYFTFDFVCMRKTRLLRREKRDEPSFETYMSRDKLRGLAVFILNYLEKN